MYTKDGVLFESNNLPDNIYSVYQKSEDEYVINTIGKSLFELNWTRSYVNKENLIKTLVKELDYRICKLENQKLKLEKNLK